MIQKIFKYKFLFSELVKRDFILKYKRTVLGMSFHLCLPCQFKSLYLQTFLGVTYRIIPSFYFLETWYTPILARQPRVA